jgi:hypothetical protein
MELSPVWEVANCAATQELPNILWNPKVHYPTGPYPEPDQFNPYHTILSLSQIHFNMVHPPNSWSSQWSLSFWLSHLYPICILLPHSCYIPSPSSLTWSFWLYLEKSTSYEAPHYVVFSNLLSLISLRSKYSPQHPVLKHPQSMFLP